RNDFQNGEFVIFRVCLHKGFEYPDIGLVLISDRDILPQDKKRSERRSNIDNTKRLKSFNDINIGDYVVHRHHGIGRYVGIHQININNAVKDYLKIQYRGTDVLYVPVDQLDMLYKYTGSQNANVKINKLGGTEWQKTTSKVKKSTGELAINLVSLYAEREAGKGYAFSEDSFYQREFEDRFIYQETEDQLRSIREVKRDMESPKPMDRLLCGDVGYGKTEIAIRAAFKAASDSKQAAYLCPTTVLAMQQYENFCSRMEDFAINVEMLSRFRTPAQQKDILKRVKSGEVDILIGTHRILQKDVQFHDLGLLIVDEEQRFGVGDKEKLKDLKRNIDVLTMTATPIPRTLHMAMIDIRDMSVLSNPPENRYPVQTYVLEHNMTILADAMRKELARGGQVFYLYNRTEGIQRAAAEIQALIPEAKVDVGHGKMPEGRLEDIMYDMVNGNTDILVCTTIIETGLDIPNANTIIIEDADKMGLSQLYQLRGRVGRSNRSAYAYFTYKKDGILSDVAQKRLSAIKEFTEFGSGFKIAMRDLEIRGAGDILGARQHGHMDAVGYDMYCKLLKESIDEIKGGAPAVSGDIDVTIELDVDAYIPDEYIRNHNQRIDMYKRIASIESEEDAVDVIDELTDRYGDIPKSAGNLIDIAYIKVLAKNAAVYNIEQKGSNVFLRFSPGTITMSTVAALVAALPSRILFNASENPYLTYRTAGETNKLLSNIKFMLQTINELKSS
ncbi:MAG: transcription-repair coupling factor, partial [Oscillospiraceae bacterium]|nr:transcription-repair coupling factor [Oscillospiraceae bacterium]